MKKSMSVMAACLAPMLFFASAANAAFEQVVFQSNFSQLSGAQFDNAVLSGGVFAGSQGFAEYGFGDTLWMLNPTENGTSLSLMLTNLPEHTHINIGGLLAVINSWDGAGGSEFYSNDYFSVSLNNVVLFNTTFSLFSPEQNMGMGARLTPEEGLSLFGIDGDAAGWLEQAYDFTGLEALTRVAHQGSELTLTFFAHGAGWQGFADESFGLGQLSVSVIADPTSQNALSDVSAPSALLTGSAFALMLLRLRRKQQ